MSGNDWHSWQSVWRVNRSNRHFLCGEQERPLGAQVFCESTWSSSCRDLTVTMISGGAYLVCRLGVRPVCFYLDWLRSSGPWECSKLAGWCITRMKAWSCNQDSCGLSCPGRSRYTRFVVLTECPNTHYLLFRFKLLCWYQSYSTWSCETVTFQ